MTRITCQRFDQKGMLLTLWRALVCAGVLVACAHVEANSAGLPSVFVAVGPSFETAPTWFEDNWKTGYHVSAGIDWGLLMPLRAGLRGEYHRFAFDYDRPEAAGTLGATQMLWLVGPEARMSLGLPTLPFRPSALLGGGIARLTTRDEKDGRKILADPVEGTELYFHAGGGIEWQFLARLSLCLQVRYLSISTSHGTLTAYPVSLGLRF